MKRKFLSIGTLVEAYQTAYPFYTNKKERIIGLNKLKNPVVGVIVGATYIIEGSYHGGYSPFGEDDPPYLIENKRHFVYLVRQGLTNKPLKVFPKDISIIIFPAAEECDIPFLYQKKYKWTDLDKDMLRKYMKDISRDSKGRWIK